MNYVTGQTIRSLRERKNLTQRELADRLMVSDKTVSKWETDRGLPDIAILGELSAALGVSVAELLTGDVAENRNRSANLKRSHFYVCPVCGNVIHAVGDGAYSCCGIRLPALEAEEMDEEHQICVEDIDGEIFVSMDHPMEKGHYISFIACLTDGVLQLQKLYPEGACEARFRRVGFGKIVAVCNRYGMVEMAIKRKK